MAADVAERLKAEPRRFGVWPENMAVVDAWMVVCSQWRTTALANGQVLWTGLDYASAKVGLDMASVALTPAQWSGLRLMERVAAAVLNGGS
jgi:uncharacterized protein YbdZ (MbtH family)